MQYYTCPKCGQSYARSDLAQWEHICPSEAERSESQWLRHAKRELAARNAAEALRDVRALLDFLRARNPEFAR